MARREGGKGRRISLRAKFYLLVLPLVAIVIAFLVISIIPAAHVLSRVSVVRSRTSDVLAAEKFQIAFSRQIRQFMSCLAGETVDTSVFEDACVEAERNLEAWASLERKHSKLLEQLEPNRLEKIDHLTKEYGQITEECRHSLKQVQEGDTEAALSTAGNVMEEVYGPVTSTTDSMILETTTYLANQLRSLLGTIDGSLLLNVVNLDPPLHDLIAVLDNESLTRKVSEKSDRMVASCWYFAMNPGEDSELRIADVKRSMNETLAVLDAQVVDVRKPGDRKWMRDAVAKLRVDMEELNTKAVTLAEIGNSRGSRAALSYMDKNMAELTSVSIPSEIDNLFGRQEKIMASDLDDITGATRKLILATTLIAGLVLLIGLGIPWLLSRKVVSPVLKLQDAATRVGSGDLDTRVEVSSRDELGDLATTFNQMVEDRKRAEGDLVKARDELEIRVEERTQELATANEELGVTNKELDGYAHTVSHDLKGPLSSVIMGTTSLSRLLDKTPDLEKEREYIHNLVGIMNDSMDQSQALIEGLLMLAEAGQKPRDVVDVDVSATVGRILDERAGDIQSKGIRVEIKGPLGYLRADPTHIYQLFSNLIGNAIRHNDSPRPVIEISRLHGGEKGVHRYLVRDNGSGIPPHELANIFVPFFKGERGETGIGLATVFKVVKVYRGDIRAYNNNGACFEFFVQGHK